MVVAQERYEPLDADGEAHVRHGRDGLPAVWLVVCGWESVFWDGGLQRPDGRERAWSWNAAIEGGGGANVCGCFE